jgi:hypothetical protein
LTVFSSLEFSIELEGDKCFCRRSEKGENIITTDWLKNRQRFIRKEKDNVYGRSGMKKKGIE